MAAREERDYDSSNIWRKSRYDSKLSQEYMANYVGVSRKTIQNWEAGVSAPDFNQGTKWFEALGINPLPYFLAYVYPENFENISEKCSDEEIDRALRELIDELPNHGKRELLYLFYGEHGSSPRAVLDLLTAHLHLPMKDRIAYATSTENNFELSEATGALCCTNHVMPDMDSLHQAIVAAKKAVKAGHSGYQM